MAANKVTAVRAGTFGNPSRCQGKLRAVGAGAPTAPFFGGEVLRTIPLLPQRLMIEGFFYQQTKPGLFKI